MAPVDTDDLFAQDPLFNYNLLATTLAKTLQRERATAFVLGLHGPWGTGKTTLLHAIGQRLPEKEIVRFNAWKFHDKEALWRALIMLVIARVREQLKAVEDEKADELCDRMERSLYESFTFSEKGALQVNWTAAAAAAVQLTIGAAAVASGGGFLASTGLYLAKFFGQKKEDGKSEDTAKQIERVSTILQRPSIQHAVQHVVSIEQFVTLFRDAVARLGDDRRIYVLIDDLDRCLPETSLQVFEAIKLFLDAPQCAYVIAVDRAVIRRGLELRYPLHSLADNRVLPPTVDPDEYIEKAITLSIDMPLLEEADGHALLSLNESRNPLSPQEAGMILSVLGTNPRRLKRFSAVFAFWCDVARELTSDGKTKLGFSPLAKDDRPLFIKLSLIGYLNSALLMEMQRAPELSGRLQDVCNEIIPKDEKTGEYRQVPNASEKIIERMKTELPLVAQAALDPAIWRAFRLAPNLKAPEVQDSLPKALRWFRSITKPADKPDS